MKRFYLAALSFLLPCIVFSQEIISKNPTVLRGQIIRSTHFQPKVVRTEQGIIGGRPEIGQYKPPIPFPELQQKEDGALMQMPAGNVAPSPYTTIDGMGYTSVCPADPTMAVSSGYIVQMINAGSGAQFQIWVKGSTSLTPTYSKKLPLLGQVTGMQGLGDCIVLYDQYDDRFIMTELSYNDNGIIVSVSPSDPRDTANYSSYFFPLGFSPDYPKYAVWNGVLYAKTNDFQGNTFTGASVFAINLQDMIHGAIQPAAVEFDLPGTYQNYSMCPVGLVGSTPFGNGGLFAYMSDNSWTGSSADSVGVLKLDPGSYSKNSSTLSLETQQAVLGFNPGVRSISQPKGQSLDALADLVMNQPVCRVLSSGKALLAMAFTVKVSSKQAGIRWTLLSNSGSWNLTTSQTYNVSDGQNRWIPSVNIDASGNIGLGFNVSGSKVYPSLANVVFHTTDGSNYSPSTEYRIATGTSSSNCYGRYGDYNHLVIDPNGSTFWLTGMYNPSSAWSTKIGSFSYSQPNPAVVRNTGMDESPIKISAYPNPVHNTLTLLLTNNSGISTVQIQDISGRLFMVDKYSNRVNSINTSSLSSGVYLLKVSNEKGINYLKFVKE